MTPPSGPSSSAEKSSLSVRSLNGEPQTPEQIEAEIEVQREQLAETIDALSAKLDVKSQAQAKVEEAKQTAQHKVAEAKQTAQHKVAQVTHTARTTAGSAQARVVSAKTRVGSASASPRPELLAFGITVLVATAVLWWRER
jgi:regulator of protease activity HflC (stomatin/prohibitin superfamily)